MAEKPVFLDTNIFLRFLTRDDPHQAATCRRLFERAEAGQLRLTTSHLALAEIVWTLESHYRLSRDEIVGTLRDLLAMKSFKIERKGMLRDAVALYASTNVDFVDAYHAAHLRNRKIPTICSFDRDFESLSIKRIEPDAVE